MTIFLNFNIRKIKLFYRQIKYNKLKLKDTIDSFPHIYNYIHLESWEGKRRLNDDDKVSLRNLSEILSVDINLKVFCSISLTEYNLSTIILHK